MKQDETTMDDLTAEKCTGLATNFLLKYMILDLWRPRLKMTPRSTGLERVMVGMAMPWIGQASGMRLMVMEPSGPVMMATWTTSRRRRTRSWKRPTPSMRTRPRPSCSADSSKEQRVRAEASTHHPCSKARKEKARVRAKRAKDAHL